MTIFFAGVALRSDLCAIASVPLSWLMAAETEEHGARYAQNLPEKFGVDELPHVSYGCILDDAKGLPCGRDKRDSVAEMPFHGARFTRSFPSVCQYYQIVRMDS